eukprot:1157962-Pelagomonas_calceolata.AAC.3
MAMLIPSLLNWFAVCCPLQAAAAARARNQRLPPEVNSLCTSSLHGVHAHAKMGADAQSPANPSCS